MALLLIGLLVSVGFFADAHPRPTNEARLIVPDFPQPPSTLDGMLTQAPLVIHGRVIKKSVQGRDCGAPPKTALEVNIIEVLKGEFPGDVITVFAPGGTIRRGGIETRTLMSDVAGLPVKSEVVLFLRRPPNSEGFVTEWGGVGSFEVSNESARIPKEVRHYPEFRGLWSVPKGELIDTFKQRLKRK